jgi:hypothetical protein
MLAAYVLCFSVPWLDVPVAHERVNPPNQLGGSLWAEWSIEELALGATAAYLLEQSSLGVGLYPFGHGVEV